jgi:hypothetical protein
LIFRREPAVTKLIADIAMSLDGVSRVYRLAPRTARKAGSGGCAATR